MALGVDGMSSDEEERVPGGIQYRILLPRWRSHDLTSWLRMFDAIYLNYRLEHCTNDRRGCMPRKRIPTFVESQSRRFIPGLPFTAYRVSWLEEQLDIANIVHPTPGIPFLHDEALSQYVFVT